LIGGLRGSGKPSNYHQATDRGMFPRNRNPLGTGGVILVGGGDGRLGGTEYAGAAIRHYLLGRPKNAKARVDRRGEGCETRGPGTRPEKTGRGRQIQPPRCRRNQGRAQRARPELEGGFHENNHALEGTLAAAD